MPFGQRKAALQKAGEPNQLFPPESDPDIPSLLKRGGDYVEDERPAGQGKFSKNFRTS